MKPECLSAKFDVRSKGTCTSAYGAHSRVIVTTTAGAALLSSLSAPMVAGQAETRSVRFYNMCATKQLHLKHQYELQIALAECGIVHTAALHVHRDSIAWHIII